MANPSKTRSGGQSACGSGPTAPARPRPASRGQEGPWSPGPRARPRPCAMPKWLGQLGRSAPPGPARLHRPRARM
eukprot:13849246-Alexandrium_andersonii.AAC.1